MVYELDRVMQVCDSFFCSMSATYVPGGNNLVMGVQCYELFGGLAIKNHSFYISFMKICSERTYFSR